MLLLARNIPPELEPLIKQILALATDLRWTWSHAGDEFWEYLDAATWKSTRNPYAVLQKLSVSRLSKLSRDKKFDLQIEALSRARDEYQNRSCWADRHFDDTKKAKIAYFSMEFGLGEALPLYAGGLGVLAGDYLKAASDLGLPAIGIGLLYDEGYFRQYLDNNGWQHEIYPHNDSRNLPLQPVFTEQGAWLTINIELPGRTVYFQVWQAQVGRTTLYLLDSNDPLNNPLDQAITGRLYAGSEELRLVQEIVLGIGGWQIIETLKLEIEICHLNEGHAAFAAIERARCFMEKYKLNFWQALWATRAGNIFTTHTPVTAAFDTFPVSLLERYGRVYAESLGIEPEELLNLGKKIPYHPTEAFNMAYLAARTCGQINGVSRLHGRVSRGIFADIYPQWPLSQIPVGHITNGVHMPSWDSALADTIWTNSCGKDRWLGLESSLSDSIEQLSDEEIWSLRGAQRNNLINYVRRRLTSRQDHWHASWQIPEHEMVRLDPNILTLGFARRFTEYKRPNLLLHDQQRLINLLSNTETPLQIIIAGKAHPRDDTGKRYIKEWFDFLRRPEIQARVVFLEDYDLRLAQHLVHGVDVWLNTPRRPWEACGTSGMKVLVNGGLNISELDGWWAEAYAADLGWALGSTEYQAEGIDTVEADNRDALQLYDLLEQQVIPCFYQRDPSGIPVNWVQMIRRSMSQLTPIFSSNRMLRDYTEKLYLPALQDFKARCDNDALLAKTLFKWESCLYTHQDKIHWGDLRIYLENGASHFAVSVYFGDIPANYLQVQLFADSLNETEPPICLDMQRGAPIPGSLNGFVFHVELETQRRREHFTPRVIGFHGTARIPAENPLINWWSGSRIFIDDSN
ncbi:MAG: starch phosphorylase [Paraglaciecola sp.]|jgi:starch phosphorylase